MAEEKAEFRNTTKGNIGACVFNGRGDRDGVAVSPGETVWLSEDEQIMTANAPRDPKNNPFVAGTGDEGRPALELVTDARPIGTHNRPIGKETAVVAEETVPEPVAEPVKTPRKRRSQRQSEETGAAKQAAGAAAEGEFATGEEVGTPDAPKKIPGPPDPPETGEKIVG